MAGRPLPGESTSGDRAIVAVSGKHAVAAAIDGLGHGIDAGRAAKRALEVVERSAEADVVSIVERCHLALRATRGVAMSLASFDCERDVMTWLGLGNVEGRLLRGGELGRNAQTLLLQGGVAGHALPRLRPLSLELRRGDVLIFATDGIGRGFAEPVGISGSSSQIAERIVERHAISTDDALVLVARYLGRA